MKKLDKLGKGIILMHDFHKHTAEALPELLKQLKAGGYKVVAMKAKAPVQTLPQYDEERPQGRQAADRELAAGLQRRADDLGIVGARRHAVPALRIEGYVIVSADGMLANADRVMPDGLKFEGDKQFFTDALDHADLIVHGRNSFEDQPNSPKRKRVILTREHRRDRARSGQSQGHAVESGRRFVRGGLRAQPACAPAPSPSSAAPTCSACSWTATTRSGCRRRRTCGCRTASPASPACPARSPQQILAAHGLTAGEPQMLDPADDVSVTPWRRSA